MTRRFALVIAWGCAALLLAVPLAILAGFVSIDSFAELARRYLPLPVQWATVQAWQWYVLLALTAAYLAVGLAGLYFLRRAFARFASGELFNRQNSVDLKRFAVLLFLQAVATPLHHALASVVLSANHPAGQKMLSISMGSGELKTVGLGMVLWVVSELLLKGADLESENRQFV